MIQSARATGYVYPYICVSSGDAETYKSALGDPGVNGYYMLIAPDGMPTCHKWNILAYYARQTISNNLFMLAADDMIFTTPCWDKALLDHYNALENKIHVYALRDSRDENGTPHPIVTREYIEAMGYFMPPIFMHWFIDSWTVEIAKANGCFTHMKDYLLIHDKPSDKATPDETHTRIRAMGWQERDTYVAKTCGHFLATEKYNLALTMNPGKYIGQAMDL